MIRAPMGDQTFWEKWTSFRREAIAKNLKEIEEPAKNAAYEAQFVWDISIRYVRLLLTRYSRGDPIRELAQHFPGILDYWELSNRLSDEICAEHNLKTCRDHEFDFANLNHYNWCFWLVGLALTLEIPDDQWRRLVALVNDEGRDVLLDRIIGSRQSERDVGSKLLHPKPYARLLKAIDAPQEKQAALLRDFVEHWYAELARPAPKNKRAPTIEPWWYIFGDAQRHPLTMGSYFGRWCIEAVAAVKAFGLDDSLCLGHEHYPGDLLRPDGPSTHPVRLEVEPSSPKPGLLTRLFGRK